MPGGNGHVCQENEVTQRIRPDVIRYNFQRHFPSIEVYLLLGHALIGTSPAWRQWVGISQGLAEFSLPKPRERLTHCV